jgi:hypothetical protein
MFQAACRWALFLIAGVCCCHTVAEEMSTPWVEPEELLKGLYRIEKDDGEIVYTDILPEQPDGVRRLWARTRPGYIYRDRETGTLYRFIWTPRYWFEPEQEWIIEPPEERLRDEAIKAARRAMLNVDRDDPEGKQFRKLDRERGGLVNRQRTLEMQMQQDRYRLAMLSAKAVKRRAEFEERIAACEKMLAEVDEQLAACVQQMLDIAPQPEEAQELDPAERHRRRISRIKRQTRTVDRERRRYERKVEMVTPKGEDEMATEETLTEADAYRQRAQELAATVERLSALLERLEQREVMATAR